MTKRHNHYEAAFEAYLRAQGVQHVAIDEARRSPHSEASAARTAVGTLKSLDFIVSPSEERTGLLIDVKGRMFPSGKSRQYWRNWTTADELQSLCVWERSFGGGFVPLLVFAYDVLSDLSPLAESELFRFREKTYGFLGVTLGDFLVLSRMISPRWNTFGMSAASFRRVARPFSYWLFPQRPAQPRAFQNHG